MVTKEQLAQLEAERPQDNHTLDYTIGGTIETTVHSSVEAERNKQLTDGYRTMESASERFRMEMAFNSREDQSKAQFNVASGAEEKFPETQSQLSSSSREEPSQAASSSNVEQFAESMRTMPAPEVSVER